jgi:hypothetical protein
MLLIAYHATSTIVRRALDYGRDTTDVLSGMCLTVHCWSMVAADPRYVVCTQTCRSTVAGS